MDTSEGEMPSKESAEKISAERKVRGSSFVAVEDDSSSNGEQILRDFGCSSVDEYDDYNPRHPQMKKGHVRGGSYFNDTLANEIALSGVKKPSIEHISELAVFSLAESRQSSFKMPPNNKVTVDPIKNK
mmetsp:Transcript_5484/g.5636  ORF Transcript_5484/g.5636 Transcript_5484/m.5636 type:complete len:129 (-) Transcript_5484:1-387(-)|eukprot:CAMPEP_0119034154 /NCGR_PEP_ID=MMETSP1177-20130426/1179_1 /TAXON_ID=2985 /ORGANISM="Ochromonas sp, Strain CCMP1899" /LENGTH=128 /DNA_ID=CAMNT_0006991407 /DNA_START=174 /DNA_END=560 /DNA_ORIENTATION=+